MNKQKLNISTLAELEIEERKVRTRLKEQEVELVSRVKRLPEEVVSTAIINIVSTIIKGNVVKSAINFAKKVGKNVFSHVLKDFE